MAKDDSRFLEKPGHLIRRLQQISLALFLDQTRAFGITPVQYSALIAIGNHPGIDQTALCNVIAFDRSTIGDVVGRLEKKKLVKRHNGSLDRRTKSLTITPAGRRLLREIEPAVQATQRLILAPLKSGQRSRIHDDAQASRLSQQRAQPGAVATERESAGAGAELLQARPAPRERP